MFLTFPETPFDLRFQLLRFPVRVTVWFWLVMALLGDWTLRMGAQFLILWVICGFVSILVHELGHALAYRWFGRWSDITLMAFGGLTTPDGVPYERWKRIVVSLAGPGFGFGMVGLILVVRFGLSAAGLSPPQALAVTLGFLYWQNLFWSLFNLLPIWPLDGGRVCRELCQASSARNPDALAFGIGFFTAAGLAVVGLLSALGGLPPAIANSLPFVPGQFMMIWMILFAIENYMLWQQAQTSGGWGSRYDDDREPWQR